MSREEQGGVREAGGARMSREEPWGTGARRRREEQGGEPEVRKGIGEQGGARLSNEK